MSGYRIPGPLCTEAHPWSIFDGTSVLWRTPSPAPVCAESWLFPANPSLSQVAVPDLSALFHQCLNPAMGLSEADYAAAAKTLAVDVATIKAVADVETSGSAFDTMGRPRILFERHYFHRLTAGRYDTRHARISAKSAGGYGKFSAQYGKLEEAYGLDPEAALSSASWGRFQIMGSHYRAAGFASVRQFVQALTRSETAHLSAFVSFVSSDESMAKELRAKDWAAFAKAYNGKGYKKNLYDDKLKAAYEHFTKDETAKAGKAPAIAQPMKLP